MLFLIEYFYLVKRLCDNFDDVDKFVEELLRFWSLVQGLFCQVIWDVDFNGICIFEGLVVMVCFVVVNRDLEKFDDVDMFDIDWDGIVMYVVFGVGVYCCIGMVLV